MKRLIAVRCTFGRLVGHFCVLGVWACLIVPTAQAQVWTYTDAQGVVQFGNEKPVEKSAVLLAGPGLQGEALVADTIDPTAERSLAQIDASPKYQAVREQISQVAEAHGVEHELIKAVVAAESAFNPQAVSPKGAVGLMQLMPATARRYGVQAEAGHSVSKRLTDPLLNLQTGTRYLADLLKMFNGQVELAVAAYNAGENAVLRAGRAVPNYPETRQYVRKVLGLYQTMLSVGRR